MKILRKYYYWFLLWIAYLVVSVLTYNDRGDILHVGLPMLVAYALLLILPGIVELREDRERA